MSHQQALTKQVFTLIDQLYKYGMTSLVISPGSRSTPIALAAELHPYMTTYIHPDERGAAFFALGKMKVSGLPVGVLCTSGTAAANYVPAVAEADLSHLPLVVLTSDRPHELRNVGAPQAINQTHMYQNYVRYQTEFPLAENNDTSVSEVKNRVLQAKQYFTGVTRGPVAINIPIREPLLPDLTKTELFVEENSRLDYLLTIPRDIREIKGNVMLVIGETCEDLSNLKDVFEYKNVTVIMDPRQNTRTKLDNVVTTHDLIFSSITTEQLITFEKQYDYIVRVGEPVTSKETNQFLKKVNIPEILVSEFIDIKPFPVTPSETYVGNIGEILRKMIIPSDGESTLYTLDNEIRKYLSKQIDKYKDEGRFMYELIKSTKNRNIFLSSSMPIRDFERYDTARKLPIYANRGANGIDGVVSSAMGAATENETTLVIGDVAMNHDLNGLLMSKLEDIDLTIVVFNNNGGNIFSYLPQYQEKEYFERLFGTPLNLNFEHAAKLYDFKYYKVNEIDELTDEMLNEKGRVMVEVITKREDNLNQHQQLRKEVDALVKDFKL